MSDSGTPRIGISLDARPHAYDPIANPELFEGVLARRVMAFVIDVIIIVVPLVFAWICIFIFGLITLGLGWTLFWMFSPASVIWALYLLWIDTVQSGIGDDRHARHGARNAHLVWRTGLFRARRRACRRVLGHGQLPYPFHPSGWLVQFPPPPIARHARGRRND
jgi:hypothetical protein